MSTTKSSNISRHGHLLLFDNSEQLEVRHVIALENYDVDVHGGEDSIPEGELWIKRNCIRLTRKQAADASIVNAMPFFLFSENCSEKEDFYHALLNSQDRKAQNKESPPEALLFNTDDMIKLIRQLHTSEENSQTRWLNALLGRLFLALYKMPETEELIRMKIKKKISRVSKPTFITSIGLEDVDMGNSAPMISNPKLKELAIDGSLIVEADIKYTGNFKLVIAAVARLELGTRFKAREVNLVLAGILKKLEGHLLIRIKPPPSNRFWIAFETMPKIDLSVEPIVSSRQITYGIVLRAIESRVREVIAETLVLPNWDDTPFTDTVQKAYRGGIWQTESNGTTAAALLERITKEALDHPADQDDEADESATESLSKSADVFPTLHAQTAMSGGASINGSLQPQDVALEVQPSPSSPLRVTPTKRPKALRSSSFATAARPIVSGGSAVSDAVIHHSQTAQHDAASSMKILSSRSPETSLASSPIRSSAFDAAIAKQAAGQTAGIASHSQPRQNLDADRPTDVNLQADAATPSVSMPRGRADSIEEEATSLTGESTPLSTSSSTTPTASTGQPPALPARHGQADRREAINHTLNTASSAAKKWGLNVLNNWQGEGKGQDKESRRKSATVLSQPIGRGQPLPPPGFPLPKPENATTWPTVAFGSVKRKPVTSTAPPSPGATLAATLAASMHSRHGSSLSVDRVETSVDECEATPPPLPRRTGSNEGNITKPAKKERID